ncbi:MAG: prefoldin subunit alpha [Methanosarcina thermophila]|jgi:prefoldin alpha subunit|uniref:Prefoldin subunit alpha n=3 Tax=Methanosarcina thermophila TaxID=2210 RepID=A0A1I6XCA3_METTE|nr:prefoldin subunit alpha [Methanosarcina thermophila]ALK04532.1 MAG: prefoldin subunit alpha [Methanosarcina sp. 795]AKB13186.1 Prefoldin alpha subunit (GimC alpha subunit) [Methanosarcina thermophila TM-1]AKB16179.1 Prefoldin alpha subunit (GimC alpha subunit) [Methanosarcina thermophila CHTI-55]NLU57148.1 prefoldin subunit alpha [Methanosarcina thermophila]SFT35733.1 prefoldin alpha subunit [Methanosarcina thermophila]
MAEVSEEVRNLAARYQEFQRQAETLRQQMNMVQASITSCDQTIVTINELKAASEGGKITETMVPVGFGSFVHAEIKNADRIIVDLGSGFSAEKTADEAIETLNRRKEQLMKILQQMNASLTHYVQGMQALESEAARLQQPGGQA